MAERRNDSDSQLRRSFHAKHPDCRCRQAETAEAQALIVGNLSVRWDLLADADADEIRRSRQFPRVRWLHPSRVTAAGVQPAMWPHHPSCTRAQMTAQSSKRLRSDDWKENLLSCIRRSLDIELYDT
jgi:hypothetical protein